MIIFERIFLKFQSICFSGRNNTKKILLIFLIIFSPILIILYHKKYIDIDILNTIINGDMFSLSGALAGFVFTGLSFIVVSDSDMINRIKESNNFITIKNFYIHSILSYVLVMILYLLKPIFLTEEIINKEIDISILREYLLMGYLSFILCIFIFGSILFLFCLFVLSRRINE